MDYEGDTDTDKVITLPSSKNMLKRLTETARVLMLYTVLTHFVLEAMDNWKTQAARNLDKSEQPPCSSKYMFF